MYRLAVGVARGERDRARDGVVDRQGRDGDAAGEDLHRQRHVGTERPQQIVLELDQVADLGSEQPGAAVERQLATH